MPERPPNGNVPKPPQRDLLREARRLERLRLVTADPRIEELRPADDPEPKRAA